MSDYQPTANTTLHRSTARGRYDRQTVFAILDSAIICHVGFCVDGQPFVLPTAFGRDGERLILHGAAAGRMLKTLATGVDLCVTVTHLDGLVLARSQFHHSFNYRSVVVLGRGTEIVDLEEKRAAMECLVEHVTPGQTQVARPATDDELRATCVLQLAIREVSAKVRTGGPNDSDRDMALPVWAGVVPLQTRAQPAEPAEDLAEPMAVPDHVRAYYRE